MVSRVLRRLVVPAVLFLMAYPNLLAAQSQATTGIIRGIVTDPAGRRAAGATVVLRETRTNYERTLTTNSEGVFATSLLPLGLYDVTVRSIGYAEIVNEGVVVRVGETVNLRLTLGAITLDEVVVTSLRVMDPARSETSTRLPELAVKGLPNNGRDFLNLTQLTPNVRVVQGPDGDEISIAGQRGIHNNVSVDGADFNNPFFGEQRGGQRPAFTFNLDAVDEIVVISDGANAEFGRSSGGFISVITKSGTNELHGTAHYFGKYDALSANATHEAFVREPDFFQHQFGFTLGGPIVRDKAFFFFAYDQQVFEDTKQKEPNRIGNADLVAFLDTAFGGALRGDDGLIERTNNARAFLAKFDVRLSNQHNLSLKYNYTWSQQENGTFDVDTWLRSSNGLEKDFSHAVNGSFTSVFSSGIANEFRFQVSREDRPRPYVGPTIPGSTAPPGVAIGERPFPDTGMDFANGFRLGLPFFLPIEYYDSRIQILDNVSIPVGDHLFKIGGEWNRVESVQTFIGFANARIIFSSVDGFLNYVANGNGYVECFDDATGDFAGTDLNATCPAGSSIGGPVILYLQQAGVGGTTVQEAGTQEIPQHEVAFFIQDSWRLHPNLTLNFGLRWEASIQPNVLTPPDQVFFSDFIGQTVTTTAGTFTFPSDGNIPSDWNNFQPRLGFAWDVKGTGQSVIRGSGGVYYARIPGLNLASTRSTNGSLGQTIFRNSSFAAFGAPPPNYDELLPDPPGAPDHPDVFVFDQDFGNPRTISGTIGFQQELPQGFSASVSYTHARTDNLTRFVNRNDAIFGNNPAGCGFVQGPWCAGLDPDGDGTADNGVGALTTVESTAKSRYNAVTVMLNRLFDPNVQFQINYTLAFDKSDDDNERDPFTTRYFAANDFTPEYNWSDRDQRHRLNAWLLVNLPADVSINNRLSAYSAQPVTETCGSNNQGTGIRAANLQDPGRLCPNGTVLKRNTLRKDNEFFSWDIRFSKLFRMRGSRAFEAIVEVFNITNTDNFRDPAFAGLLFNFDGTVQSGLGDPREVQVGGRFIF